MSDHYSCVRCGRKMTRAEVIGFTHLTEWTWICRDSGECERIANSRRVATVDDFLRFCCGDPNCPNDCERERAVDEA